MQVKAQDQIAFFLTGHHNGSGLTPLDRSFRPALFSRYADLTSLRYDFPLVLNTSGEPERAILSLSALVDDAVGVLREDADRDRIAHHGYQLESELRRDLVSHSTAGTATDFATMWDAAASRLASENPLIQDSAKRLWALFHASGELVDVTHALPSRVARHLWSVVASHNAKVFREKSTRLLMKLHGILEAEVAASNLGRSPERLRAGLAAQAGASFATTFNVDAFSRMLVEAKPALALSEKRRHRIESLIEILERQRFYPTHDKASAHTESDATPEEQTFSFVFYRCADALQAYKDRRTEAIELLKALATAELEVKGEYRESANDDDASSHDKIFQEFGVGGLDPAQLAALPDYLVLKNSSELGAEETLQIIEALSTGLPIRVVVQTDDLLEPSGISRATLAAPERHLALASRSRHMLDTALGLSDVFVLQSSASQLFRLRDKLLRGMSYSGPAFFSIFSGSTGHTGDVPPYLVAAAATESRAFPSIVYDPSAGSDWASRFQLKQNPDPENAWPVRAFEYENETLQTHSENLAFTLADFIAMDDRFREHFAVVPKANWNDAMIAIPASLDVHQHALPSAIPCISLVDGEGRLQRAIVNRRALEETRRSQNMWHSLQELGGIHNSHAERLVEQLKAQLAAAAAVVKPVAAQAVAAVPASVAPADAASAEAPVAIAQEESHGDDPYIETARCTTCNECTQVNPKMFAYNGDKQAYIADPDGGTYRQLVEAAEGCQVSIIHPGKPRNPKEPGLDELMKRAEAFK